MDQILPNYLNTTFEFPNVNVSQLVNNSSLNVSSRDANTGNSSLVHLDNCLSYYLVYINGDGNIEAFNCIRLNAKWMEEMFDVIKSHPMIDLMIPGTHDASSYHIYDDDYEKNSK